MNFIKGAIKNIVGFICIHKCCFARAVFSRFAKCKPVTCDLGCAEEFGRIAAGIKSLDQQV